MERLLLALMLVAALPAAAQSRVDCEAMLEAELPAYLRLPPQQFDQDDAQGWRRLSRRGCYHEAMEAIDAYVQAVDAPYHVHFHGAQMAATSGDYARARAFLAKALRPEMAEDEPFKWNAYVRAVDAFLRGDLEALKHERTVIGSRLDVKGNEVNLKVVDRMIAGIGRPYALVFE